MKSRSPDRPPVIGNAVGNSTRPWPEALAFGALALSAGLVPIARAEDSEFAKTKTCMNGHALDEKRVGPPFKTVAARYANDRSAEDRLAEKIRNGGSGAWGVVPMPANGDVTQNDAKRLAHWVLMAK